MTGSLSYARRISRQTGDFSGGTAVFHTIGPDDRDCTALVPLDGWLKYLGSDPTALADRLELLSKTLVLRWKERNEKLPPKERKPVCWSSEICRRVWKNVSGKREVTVFEVHLNTFNLNQIYLDQLKPNPIYDEVKILIKARSSLNTEFRADQTNVDSEGLALDCKGFNKEIRHFLGYLRSQDCADQLKETLEARSILVQGLPTNFPKSSRGEASTPDEPDSTTYENNLETLSQA